MSVSEQPIRQNQPLRLIRNVTYPTYQLYAIAGNGKLTAESVLKIVMLETLNWLRQRFQALDEPEELKWPPASQFAEVDCRNFKSFRIDRGYKLEVICLPEEKIWALQLTEPDLGSQPENLKQSRAAVPGRLIETNIAYRIVAGQVECGFRTLVSDPVGITEPCEVFRYSFIKLLVRNPLVELHHGMKLTEDAIYLDSPGKTRNLVNWLKAKDRMMPCLVMAECAAEQVKPVDLAAYQKISLDAASIHQVPIPNIAVKPPGKIRKWPFDITNLAHYRMGYAQFYTLPLEQQKNFVKYSGQAIGCGDVLLFEPLSFGGDVLRSPYQNSKADSRLSGSDWEKFSQDYCRNKPVLFGNVVFLPEAKEIDRSHMVNRTQSKEELLHALEEREEAIKERYQTELQEAEGQVIQRDRKISALKEEIHNLDVRNRELREQMELLKEKHQTELQESKNEILRLRNLKNRPVRPTEVAGWVAAEFKDRLVFHQRACAEMSAVEPNEINLELLCNALEYLATDYRDNLLGIIDTMEMQRRCAQKYEQPFKITPVNGVSVEKYAREYKIKWRIGFKGKPVECPLNLHLKAGIDNTKLIRIYFLYDSALKLIVVGSLPDHLPTISYK
ncbi:MAG: hypothetical protein LLG09_01980 [Negativicutes bacterium]|nr:hypothetical protein [Negativicutes bacterium]